MDERANIKNQDFVDFQGGGKQMKGLKIENKIVNFTKKSLLTLLSCKVLKLYICKKRLVENVYCLS